MPHHIKRGDLYTLTWNLGRDLTGVTSVRVLISNRNGKLLIDRAGIIDEPATSGTVSLALLAEDWDLGKLQGDQVYRVEIETQPGPVTHPDDGYEKLIVGADLG